MVSWVLTAIGIAIGGYFSNLIWKEFQNGGKISIAVIIVSVYLWLAKGYYIGLTFPVLALLTGILAGMGLVKCRDGVLSGKELYKAFHEKRAAKARANPTLAMIDTINLNIENNATSPTTFFAQQQKESDEWTEQRINTIGDINAGRAPNGTNGVWLKH